MGTHHVVAALFGFTGLAAASADVARILFYIFLVIFLVLLVLGLVGREPRADLDLQRALPSPATRGGGKTRTPLECGIRKERLLERGLGNPQGGWGDEDSIRRNTLRAANIPHARGRHAGFISGTASVCPPGRVFARSLYGDLRRVFRAPSQSLPGSRSPSLASSMMNLASTTASGS